MILNWTYIFLLFLEAYFITSVAILMPFLIPLFVVLLLLIALGLYYSKNWAYVFEYCIIISSVICLLIAYHLIPRIVVNEWIYLWGVLFCNFIALVYLTVCVRLVRAGKRIN